MRQTKGWRIFYGLILPVPEYLTTAFARAVTEALAEFLKADLLCPSQPHCQ